MRPAAEIHRKKLLSGGAETVAEAPDMHTAETSLDYQGTYTGTFPGADCPGIDTRLVLKKDGTFDLHMKYLERDSEFEDKGGYSVKGNLLTLTPENGEGIEYYKVEENRLRRLDADKQPMTGSAGRKLRIEEDRIKPRKKWIK